MAQATCEGCSGVLTGRQTRFCSTRCGQVFYTRDWRARNPEATKAADATYQRERRVSGRQDLANRRWHNRRQLAKMLRQLKALAAPATLALDAGPKPRRPEAVRRLWKATQGRVSNRTWAQGNCAGCGTPFLAFASGTPPTHCTTRCSRNDAKRRRRAVKSGAFVENVYRRRVFERDSWRCQICRKLVKRDAVVPHPKAPVIDHILPLAAGGEHSMRNAQCAHFLCNSLKRDQAANDQLRLIG